MSDTVKLIIEIPKTIYEDLKAGKIYSSLCEAPQGLIEGIQNGTPLSENKGEWISHYDEDAKEGWYECSCCHSERAFNTKYCPDCGADMRG